MRVLRVLCEIEASLRENSVSADIFPGFFSQQPDNSLFYARLFYTFPKQFVIFGENSSGLLNGSVGGHESQSLREGERRREEEIKQSQETWGLITALHHQNRNLKPFTCQTRLYQVIITNHTKAKICQKKKKKSKT